MNSSCENPRTHGNWPNSPVLAIYECQSYVFGEMRCPESNNTLQLRSLGCRTPGGLTVYYKNCRQNDDVFNELVLWLQKALTYTLFNDPSTRPQTGIDHVGK